MSNTPRPVRGMHDLLPSDYHAHAHVIQSAEKQASLAGFSRVETPLLEETRLFDRSLGASSDIVGKEMYSFETRGGEQVSLRPEGTASIVRAYFSNGLAQSVPLRYFYAGAMFRYERPQKGRLRQFHQFGAELIGAGGYLADAEILALAAATLQCLGVDQQVTLHLNTLGSSDDRQQYRSALQSYFTRHRAALSADSLRRLETNPLRILDSKEEQDRALFDDAPLIDDFLDPESLNRFTRLCATLEDMNIDYQRDHRLVRGLDYYEHTTFEFITDRLGAQGTVLAGGCYDRLFEIIGAKPAAGAGFAAGIERLAAMTTTPAMPKPHCVLVPMDEQAEEAVPVLSQSLRRAGIITVFDFSGKLKTRLRRCDQSGAPFAVLFDAATLSQQQVKLKNMRDGNEQTLSIPAMQNAVLEYLQGKEYG